MKVWMKAHSDLASIGEKLGIELYNVRHTGRALSFVLRPPSGSERYRAIRNAEWLKSGQRKAWAVCWHGHRDFMRAIFEIDPEARIKTCWADYRGRDGFEETFPETGQRNIGSVAFPLYAGQACACGEGGAFLTDAEKVEQAQAS